MTTPDGYENADPDFLRSLVMTAAVANSLQTRQ